jgi:hypothetical protein
MQTAFQLKPGFFAAYSRSHNPCVPEGKMRIYCARIEAYDIDIKPGTPDDETAFTVLPALAEGEPEIALALTKLGESLAANRAELEKQLG